MNRKYFSVQQLVGRCPICVSSKEAAYIVVDMQGIRYGEFCKTHAEEQADEAEQYRGEELERQRLANAR